MIGTFILTSSLRNFSRPSRIFGWILAIFFVFLISYFTSHYIPSLSSHNPYVLLSATLAFRILPLAAAIFSTSVVSQEISQKTIVYLLTRPVDRWLLLTMRTVAAIVLVFLVSAISLFAVSVGSVGLSNPQFLPDLGAILVGSIAYTSLFTFVSLLMNRSMIACLLFAFVWETAVPNMPGDLYRLTISGYLTSIAHRPAYDGPKSAMDALAGLMGVNVISSTSALFGMLILAIACMVAGALWFTKFEYVGREDVD